MINILIHGIIQYKIMYNHDLSDSGNLNTDFPSQFCFSPISPISYDPTVNSLIFRYPRYINLKTPLMTISMNTVISPYPILSYDYASVSSLSLKPQRIRHRMAEMMRSRFQSTLVNRQNELRQICRKYDMAASMMLKKMRRTGPMMD